MRALRIIWKRTVAPLRELFSHAHDAAEAEAGDIHGVGLVRHRHDTQAQELHLDRVPPETRHRLHGAAHRHPVRAQIMQILYAK